MDEPVNMDEARGHIAFLREKLAARVEWNEALESRLALLENVAETAREYERLETERVTGIRASDGDIVSMTREAKERLFEAVRAIG